MIMPRNPYYTGTKSDHFDGTRFHAHGGQRDKTSADIARMLISSRSKRQAWPKNIPIIEAAMPPERVEGSAIHLTFIGHSSFLLQTQGVNLLLDPVWSNRAGPRGLLGPKRVTKPGLALKNLPPIDAILLSHNHYDHMDIPTLIWLAKHRPCPVLTPLGNDTILHRADKNIDAHVFDWGDAPNVGALKIHFEPAIHWSSRFLSDKRMALWCSFVIEGAGLEGASLEGINQKIYFAGDTGFGDGSLFKGLVQKHGKLRLALLPIGAYAPRWFMKDFHTNPEEAVKILEILQAEQAFACHWGTFRLTQEPYDEPVELLKLALEQANIDPSRFVAEPAGSVFELEH